MARVLSEQTYDALKRKIGSIEGGTSANNTSGSAARIKLVCCESATPIGGSDLLDECYVGRVLAPASDVIGAQEAEEFECLLTVLGEDGEPVTPTEGMPYLCIMTGTAPEDQDSEKRVRFFGVESGGGGGGSPLTTKGDIYTHDSSVDARLPVGSDGQFLVADSAQATGIKWANASPSSSPLTTKGDLFGYSTTNARVPVGTNGLLLTADSSQALGVKWGNALPGMQQNGFSTINVSTNDTWIGGTVWTAPDSGSYVFIGTASVNFTVSAAPGIARFRFFNSTTGAVIGSPYPTTCPTGVSAQNNTVVVATATVAAGDAVHMQGFRSTTNGAVWTAVSFTGDVLVIRIA